MLHGSCDSDKWDGINCNNHQLQGFAFMSDAINTRAHLGSLRSGEKKNRTAQ